MKIISLIFLSLLFINCASFSTKTEFKDKVNLSNETVSKINGVYNVNPSKTLYKFDNLEPKLYEDEKLKEFNLFSNLLNPSTVFRNDNDSSNNYRVKILARNNKKISFYLIKNEKISDSINFKYKIKKGMVYFKVNSTVTGIPILFGSFIIDRFKIGVNQDNNLIFHSSHYANAQFFIIIGAEKKFSSASVFKRI